MYTFLTTTVKIELIVLVINVRKSDHKYGQRQLNEIPVTFRGRYQTFKIEIRKLLKITNDKFKDYICQSSITDNVKIFSIRFNSVS